LFYLRYPADAVRAQKLSFCKPTSFCPHRFAINRAKRSHHVLSQEVTKLIDARGQLTTNPVQERLIKEIAIVKGHDVQYWPIFLRGTDEQVGCCGLRSV
jgi:hypothetical protein